MVLQHYETELKSMLCTCTYNISFLAKVYGGIWCPISGGWFVYYNLHWLYLYWSEKPKAYPYTLLHIHKHLQTQTNTYKH